MTFGGKQEELQEMYRWKLAFDAYKDQLPVYYYDYLNSFIKFLQMNPSLMLPPTE
jgi:lipopolysaccharide biosynthesis protein